MTLTWHSLATAGAPAKINPIAAMDIKHRKLYSPAPTVNGQVAPAAPAAPVAPVAAVVRTAPVAPVDPVAAAPLQPQRMNLSMLPGFSGLPLHGLPLQSLPMQPLQYVQSLPLQQFAGAPAFSFPGAVNILNAAAPTSVVSGADKENQMEEEDYDSCDGDDPEEHYEKLCGLVAKTDCDAMRRKIQRFLARKTMTQTAFLRKIDCNSNSYRMFMSYKGKRKGENNQVYDGALIFFHKLEKEEGLAVGNKRASKAKGASTDKDAAAGPAKVSRKDQQAQTQEFLDKISAVELQEPVYVFDDCDDIRKKINEVIASKKLTQAALLRAMDVNSNSLRRFLTTKGKREGCSNGVYYSAYCFFEKLRVAHGVAKTNKRLKNEREMSTGYSLKREPTHMWVFTGKGL